MMPIMTAKVIPGILPPVFFFIVFILTLTAKKSKKWGHPRYFLFFKDGFGFPIPRFFMVCTSMLERGKIDNIDCAGIFRPPQLARISRKKIVKI